MKKPTVWGAIIGAILVAGNAYNVSNALTHPTDLPWVNVAIAATYFAWIAFGLFLVAVFFKTKQKEDAGQIIVKPAPDTPEDIQLLEKRRRWILSIVLMVASIPSIQGWILNDYAAGLTLINFAVIFDLVFNILFLYVVVEMLRNKRDVLPVLLYASILYGIGGVVIPLLRHHWYSAILSALVAVYFVFAIKAPLNRKNHRIAHLMILPAIIVVLYVGTYFDNDNIPDLTKNESLVEQQFANDSSTLNNAYQLYLQKDVPDKVIIQEVKDDIAGRDKRIQAVIDNLGALKAEYEKQLPNISQKEVYERIRYLLELMDTHRAQGAKLQELMDYSAKLNFNSLSDQQRLEISRLKKEVESYITQLTEIEFKLENANLNG